MDRLLIWPAASVFALILVACGDTQDVPKDSVESNSLCRILPGKSETLKPTNSGVHYFPPSFGNVTRVCDFKGYPECFPTISNFENEWYSKHLHAAQEPSLYELSNAKKSNQPLVLRFTWLPTFDHPVIVRFELSSGTMNIVAKELSGAGGYEPGSINRQISRQLSSAEARQITEAMTKASPFSEPLLNCELGVDGSTWMLERAERGNYEFTDRWSPENGAMRDFGLLALKMTGWKFKNIY